MRAIRVLVAVFAVWTTAAPGAAKVRSPLETPLILADIDVDRQTLSNGNELVVVAGRVVNQTGEIHRVPRIEAKLRSRSGELLYSWIIESPVASLAAGESATFESAEVDVPPSGLDSTLTLTLLDGTDALSNPTSSIEGVRPEFKTWRVVRASNGDLSAEIRSRGPAPSTTAVLSINCNERGMYSVVMYEGSELVTDPEMRKYLEDLGNPPWTEYPTESWIETYRGGNRTARFGVNGSHRGQGDPLTRERLQALSSAEDIRVLAEDVVLRFTGNGSGRSIAKLVDTCPLKR